MGVWRDRTAQFLRHGDRAIQLGQPAKSNVWRYYRFLWENNLLGFAH